MGTREEIAAIIDIVRADRRNLFEKSPMAKLTLDQMVEAVRKEGLFITNLYEGHDGTWRCHLRYYRNKLLAGPCAHGQTMAEALWQAFDACRQAGYPDRDKPEPPPKVPPKVEAAKPAAPAAPVKGKPGPKPKGAVEIVSQSGVEAEDIDLLGDDEDEDLLG